MSSERSLKRAAKAAHDREQGRLRMQKHREKIKGAAMGGEHGRMLLEDGGEGRGVSLLGEESERKEMEEADANAATEKDGGRGVGAAHHGGTRKVEKGRLKQGGKHRASFPGSGQGDCTLVRVWTENKMTGAWPSGEHNLPFRRVVCKTLIECLSWAGVEKARGKVTVCHLTEGNDVRRVKECLQVDHIRSTHVLIVVGLPAGPPGEPHVAALVEAYEMSEKAVRVKLNSPFLDSYSLQIKDSDFLVVQLISMDLKPEGMTEADLLAMGQVYLDCCNYALLQPLLHVGVMAYDEGLHDRCACLYEKVPRTSKVAGAKRGDPSEFMNMGYHTCANVQASNGDIAPYKSYLVHKEEVGVIADAFWRASLKCVPGVLMAVIGQQNPHGATHLTDVVPVQRFHMTRNYWVDLHVDQFDCHGSLIVWSNSEGRSLGGGFYLPDLGLRFDPAHLTVAWVRTDILCHGSVAPERGTRFGTALVNNKQNLARCKNQVVMLVEGRKGR